MKILGVVGSPRKNGNSYHLVGEALKASKEVEPALQTEIVELADFQIESCRACESCGEPPYECIIKDDFSLVFNKMKEADGLLIAAPRYGPLGACPSKMQALLERLVNVNWLPAEKNPDFCLPLEGKPCGLIVVSGEGRQNNIPVLHSLEQYALAYRLRVVHAPQWPWVGIAGKGSSKKDDVLQDQEAIKNAQQLGKLLVKELKM